MKLAALYDIHGNLPALEAVLKEIESDPVDAILIGGDVVAGPFPSQTLDRLNTLESEVDLYYLHGNAESETLDYIAGRPHTGLAPVDIVAWIAARLSPQQRSAIADWPLTQHIEGVGFACHATPTDDITVFTRDASPERLEALFGSVESDLILVGHTHLPFDLTHKGKRIINPGSVGMPFGRVGAHWLRIENGDVAFQVTKYPLKAAANRIMESGYPIANGFANGNVLNAPSDEAAMHMLKTLEKKQRMG